MLRLGLLLVTIRTLPMPMQCGPELGIRVRCRPPPQVLDVLALLCSALLFSHLERRCNQDLPPALLTVGRPCRIAGRRGHGIAASKWMEAHQGPGRFFSWPDVQVGGVVEPPRTTRMRKKPIRPL
ncbi:hypothetical protein J3F84DRAFT_186822 [Trichoderma pleuroticola]